MAEKIKAQRSYDIELLRVFLMFGICVIHSAELGEGRWAHWMASIFRPCLDAFVLISGFYGVRLSVVKILKLYGLGIYAAGLAGVYAFCVQGIDVTSALGLIIKTFNGYWFLHAYVIMMLFAPMINLVFETGTTLRTKVGIALPIIFLVFGWSFLATAPFFNHYIPQSIGFDPYTGYTLVGLYTSGRLVRCYDDKLRKVSKCLLLGGLIILLLMTIPVYGILGRYNSPVALVAAILLLLLAKDTVVPKIFVGIVRFLVPSLFSVYLISTNDSGRDIMRTIESQMLSLGCPLNIAILFDAIVVLVFGIILDMPRRLLISVSKIKCLRG